MQKDGKIYSYLVKQLIGGATISSDGTGTVAVSATGVTLPSGSKAGENKIVLLDRFRWCEQAATVFFF